MLQDNDCEPFGPERGAVIKSRSRVIRSLVAMAILILYFENHCLAASSSPSNTVVETAEPAASDASSVPEAEKKGAKVFMWKATRGKDVVYLLGTIHGAIGKFYPLPGVVDRAFDSSKHLVVEVDITKVPPSTVSALVAKVSSYTPPDRLSRHLSPETKKVFGDYLKWSGETWAMYEQFKPWYAARLASNSKRWVDNDFKSSLGLDLYFIGRAEELKKNVLDLETAELQIRCLSDMSDKAQDKVLHSTLQGLIDSNSLIQGFLDAWKTGDVDKMQKLSFSDLAKYPELLEYDKRLLDDRNVGMANKILQFLAKNPGPYFVAVGSAHMVGTKGLVSLLRAKGFDVQQQYDTPEEPDIKVAAKTATQAATIDKSHAETGKRSIVEKRVFPEQFKLALPLMPRRFSVAPSTIRYELYEPPFGGFIICSILVDVDPAQWSVPGPLLLDHVMSSFPLTEISRRSLSYNGAPGRELECVLRPFSSRLNVRGLPDTVQLRDDAKLRSPFGFSSALAPIFASGEEGAERAKIRCFLVGRRILILAAHGTKEWLKTDHVVNFFDSFEIVGK